MKVGDRARMKATGLMDTRAQRAGELGGDALVVVHGRPSPTLGLLAVLLGAVLATWLAHPFARRRTMRQRLRRGRKRFGAALALLPLALKLLSNPIARAYLRGTVTRRISRKLGR
jgi:hypothetical protein